MFEDSEHVTDKELNTFKINKKYEKKFIKRKQREEIDRAKAKYGKNYEKVMAGELENSSGSSLAEDEDGELLNDEVRKCPKLKKDRIEIFDHFGQNQNKRP